MENPVVQIIRAIARPAISIIFAAVIAQIVIEGITAPEWFLALAIPTIVWWFGERAITHIKAKNANNFDTLVNKVATAIEKKNG